MLGFGLIGRNWPPLFRKLAWSALGGSCLMLLVSISAAIGADDPVKTTHAVAAALANAADLPDEAFSGFTNTSNGLTSDADFAADMKTFQEVETIVENGLGPVYNATSCVGCHQNPVTGSSSQVAVLRSGHRVVDPKDSTNISFVEPPGGSLIQQRATNAEAQVKVLPGFEVRALRMSTNLLGNGFIEMIPDEDILALLKAQPDAMKGLPVVAAVTVGVSTPGGNDFTIVERLGRFGWKNQEASLLNFAAGAYLNEMGVTSPMQPKENTSNGHDVTQFDFKADPEDDVDPKDPEHPFGNDVKAFTRFIRATRVPPRELTLANTSDAREGEKLFRDNAVLGCAICHQPDFTTPKAGTAIKALYIDDNSKPGSDLKRVPDALGNKTFHPYSDFMLHDIGTGDGIAQTQHAQRPTHNIQSVFKAPASVLAREKIARVKAVPHEPKVHQRILTPEIPGLDMRTIDKMRTAPLWGLRVRPQLLHDGSAITIDEAIRKHQGQAKGVTQKYLDMVAQHPEQARQLIAFLSSL